MDPRLIAREVSKDLGYRKIKFLYGPEGVAFDPQRRLALFTFPGKRINYPAMYHELGHLYIGTKLPLVTAISDIGTAFEGVSPFLAAYYIARKAKNFRLKNLLTALAIWKLPLVPRFAEELAATVIGARLAKKKRLPEYRKALISNLPYLMTYI